MFKLVEESRNNFHALQISDLPDKFTKLQSAYLNNYRHFACFSKFLAFAKSPDNSTFDVEFAWRDGLSNERRTTRTPQLEMYASLYNCAVSTVDLAGKKDTGDDEQLRVAFLYYRQAAWLFDHLLAKSGSLPAQESTLSLSAEVLAMNSFVCQAKA